MTDQTNAVTSDDANAKPKKKKRRLLKIVGALFVLLIVFVLLLPTIVSTGFGTGIVLSFVNDSLPGEVEIDELNVGWFSSTSVKGLRLKDPEGNVILAASADVPDVTLLSLVQGNKNFGNVTLTADEVNIEQYEDGTLNLQRALGPSEDKDDQKETTYPQGFAIKLALKAPNATFKPFNQEPAVLTEGELQVNIASGQQIAYSVTGQIEQGGFKGRIKSAADVKDLFSADGKLQISKLQIEAPDNSAEAPTKLIDSLSNAGGRLAAIVGPTVKVTYSASGSLSDLKTRVNVKADLLNLNANTTAKFDDDLQLIGLVLDDGELLRLKITRDTFEQLVKAAGDQAEMPFEFVSAGDMVINSHADIKPGEAGVDLFKSTATFTVAPMKITIKDPKLGERTLSIDGITIQYDGPNNGHVIVNGKAQTGQGNETGTLAFNGQATQVFKPDGSIDYEKLTVNLNADVKDFALSLLDELLMTDGMLAKAVGGKLNANARVDLKPTENGNEGTWSLVAKADQLDANLSGPIQAARKQTDDGVAFDNVVMKLGEPGRVSARLSKPVITLLREKVEGIDALFDRADLTDRGVTLTVKQFEAPIDQSLLAKVNAELAVVVDPFTAKVKPGDDAASDVTVQVQNLTATATFAGREQPIKTGINGRIQHGAHNTNLNVTADVTDLFNTKGEISADTLTAKINAELTNVPTALADALINKQNLAREGLGESVNVSLAVNAKLNKAGDQYKYHGDGQVTLKSTHTDVKLTGKLIGDRLQLDTAPDASFARTTLTPTLVKAFQPTPAESETPSTPWNIAKPTPIHITFNKGDLPLDGDIASAVINLTAAMDELALTGDPRFDGASVKELKATIQGDNIGKQLTVNVDGKLLHGSDEGKLIVKADVARPLDDTRGINASVTLQNAPTALADAFADMDGLIGKLEDKTIKSVALTYKSGGETADTFGVNVDAKSLQVDVAGAFTPGQRLALSPNQTMTVKVTPTAWPIIRQQFGEQLPTMLRDAHLVSGTMKINIPSMDLALAEVKTQAKQAQPNGRSSTVTTAVTQANESANPSANQTTTKLVAARSKAVIEITSNDLTVQRKPSSTPVKVTDFKARLDADRSLSETDVLVNAKLPAAAKPAEQPPARPDDRPADRPGLPILPDTPPKPDQPLEPALPNGTLNVIAKIKGLVDDGGYFSAAKPSINAKVNGAGLPARELDDMLNQNGLLIGLFKDKADLTSHIDLTPGQPGSFSLDLRSGNAVATGKGIIENDTLKLTEDFTATVMLNRDMPDVMRNFFVGIKVVSDDKPVALKLPAKTFAWPLNFGDGPMLDMKTLKTDVVFDVGTARAEGDGPLASAADLIVKLTRAEKKVGRVTAVIFDEADIALKHGIVTYKKPLKMQYAGVAFVYNGEINLLTGSIEKLSITVPFSSINAKEIRGLAGGIPLPLSGTLAEQKLDFGKLQKEMVNVALKAGLNRGLGELIPGGNQGGLPGLEGLFPPRNKPDPNKPDDSKKDGKQSSNDDGNTHKKPSAEDAAIDILRGVLGGNKNDDRKYKDDDKKDDEKKDDQNSKPNDDGKGLLEGLIGGDKKDKKQDNKKE